MRGYVQGERSAARARCVEATHSRTQRERRVETNDNSSAMRTSLYHVWWASELTKAGAASRGHYYPFRFILQNLCVHSRKPQSFCNRFRYAYLAFNPVDYLLA